MFKQVKEYIKAGFSIRRFKSAMKEKRLSVDDEHVSFIRGKRKFNNLPDSWDTQWIKRPKKSWKEQSKNKHQYDKIYHTLSEKTHSYNWPLRDKFEEDELLFLLKTKFKNDWYYFHYAYDENGKINLKELYNVKFENQWYDVAERLVKSGKVEAKFYKHSWSFDNFGTIEEHSENFIVAIKLK